MTLLVVKKSCLSMSDHDFCGARVINKMVKWLSFVAIPSSLPPQYYLVLDS